MNVIYLFYDGNNIKIPFYGNKNNIFCQLTQSNGVWDNVYYGFIFKKDIDFKKIINLFGAVCVVYNETTGKYYNSKLKIYGFLEYSEKEKLNVKYSANDLRQAVFLSKVIITANGFIRCLTILHLMIIIQRKLHNFAYRMG